MCLRIQIAYLRKCSNCSVLSCICFVWIVDRRVTTCVRWKANGSIGIDFWNPYGSSYLCSSVGFYIYTYLVGYLEGRESFRPSNLVCSICIKVMGISRYICYGK